MLEWLPIGPVGRNDPTWFVALKNRNCGVLQDFEEPFSTVEEAARTLCQGLDGNLAAWETGVSNLAAMEQTLPDDCWSTEAYRVLRQIADFRAKNPDTPFRLVAGPGTACPPILETLENDAGDQPPGSVCAGDAIKLVGRLGGLPAGSIRTVNVGAATASVQYRENSRDNTFPFGDFYFLAPTPGAAGSTQPSVTIADDDWNVTGSEIFDYAVESACPGFVPPAQDVVPPAQDVVPPAQDVVPPGADPAQPGTVP